MSVESSVTVGTGRGAVNPAPVKTNVRAPAVSDPVKVFAMDAENVTVKEMDWPAGIVAEDAC